MTLGWGRREPDGHVVAAAVAVCQQRWGPPNADLAWAGWVVEAAGAAAAAVVEVGGTVVLTVMAAPGTVVSLPLVVDGAVDSAQEDAGGDAARWAALQSRGPGCRLQR